MVCKVNSIVMEASSKEDRQYMEKMSKDDIHKINGQQVQNLYQAVMKKSNIDFGDIPDSKGDIEKVKYYDSTIECLKALEELFRKNNINEPGVSVVKLSISNMKRFRPQFMNGFKSKHEFIMLTYNSLVMSIIDATSALVGSYMDFLVTDNANYAFNPHLDKKRSSVALSNLSSFNKYCERNQFGDALNYMLNEQTKNFMGETVVVTGAIILCLLNIVPLIREIVYFYYHKRVQLSDYLEMQASFLEMNKLAVEASKKSPSEKKSILKKQENAIKKMRKMSDKLSIKDVDTNDVVKKVEKEENSMWSLSNIEKQLSKNKLDGSTIKII